MWDAEHAPENVGFSHNVQARTTKRGEQTIVEEILAVQSVDLVADPATTRGLFESAAEATSPHPSAPGSAGGSANQTTTTNTASSGDPTESTGDLVCASNSSPPAEPGAESGKDSTDTKVESSARFDQLSREQSAEIQRLRDEIDQLKAAVAQEQKRATIAARHTAPMSREQSLFESRDDSLDAFLKAIRT